MTDSVQAAKRKSSPGIDLDVLPDLLGYHIRLAQIAVFRDFAAAFGDFEITPTLYASLLLIGANPGLKQTDLAQAVQLDRSTVVSVIDNLEGRELVERNRAADDRRSNALSLTRKGKALLARLKPLVEAHERRLVRNLTPDEAADLKRLLNKIFPEYR
ncbi:MAG: MarR family winged helix-turn-helix transcriptional regulator [Gammaproteobacteria bacterium]